jgi:hypothetical protein
LTTEPNHADAMMQPLGDPIRCMDDLRRFLRARVEQLDCSRECLDRISGLTPGHSSKLLSPIPLKGIGSTTLPLLLGGTGVMLVPVEDPEAMRRISRMLEKREVKVSGRSVPWGRKGTHTVVSKRFVKRIAREGGHARAEALTPAQRRASARKAAKARWRKPRVVEITRPPGRPPKAPSPAERAHTNGHSRKLGASPKV